jgi:hypothetical protein
LELGGKSKGRDDPEKVRAAREAVESANGKGGVGVAVRCRFGVFMAVGMDVNVAMGVAVVGMFVHVEVVAEGLVQAPQTQGDEDDADHALRPPGERINGQYCFEEQGEDAHAQHAARVAYAPADADSPGRTAAFDRQRGHRREVIRAR